LARELSLDKTARRKYLSIRLPPSLEERVTWTQVYDPLGHWWLSTLVAALPVIVLLGLLAGFKVQAHWCAVAGAATAVLCAILVFHMPGMLALTSFGYGAAYGLLKIVWIVVAAVFLYDITVATGQFEIMKHSVAGITADRRLQLLLIAFCFGAFIEGAAGFGTPVAIAGAFMIGLGFKPFHAAALNLIANTAPVAWGAIGTPVHALQAVTGLPESDLNAMIGRILPFTAVIVPFWLVRAMVSWSETFEVLPAILVVGISFAGTQFFWSNYMDSNLVDIAAGVVSLGLHADFFAGMETEEGLAIRGRTRRRCREAGEKRSGQGIHRRADCKGVDALRDSFPLCVDVGAAHGKGGDGESDYTGVQNGRLGSAVFAQNRVSRAAGSSEAHRGKCKV
jgi:L-lactate permease